MLLRSLLITAALFTAGIAASAQVSATHVTGDFRTYEAAQSTHLRSPRVASTDNAGIRPVRTRSASVTCGRRGERVTYTVTVQDGICGGAEQSATCISQTPPGFAQATCDLGCRPTTGTGTCSVS